MGTTGEMGRDIALVSRPALVPYNLEWSGVRIGFFLKLVESNVVFGLPAKGISVIIVLLDTV